MVDKFNEQQCLFIELYLLAKHRGQLLTQFKKNISFGYVSGVLWWVEFIDLYTDRETKKDKNDF